MRREVGADRYGRCAGAVTGHVESLCACEWGYFVGAYLVGVGGVADDPRGRKLMKEQRSWSEERAWEKLAAFDLSYRGGYDPDTEAKRNLLVRELLILSGVKGAENWSGPSTKPLKIRPSWKGTANDYT
jgi:hypothetical protein